MASEPDLPEAAAPRIDPPEPPPGGADAITGERYGDTPGPPTTRDLAPADNPETKPEKVPDEVTEPEDEDGTDPEQDATDEPSG